MLSTQMEITPEARLSTTSLMIKKYSESQRQRMHGVNIDRDTSNSVNTRLSALNGKLKDTMYKMFTATKQWQLNITNCGITVLSTLTEYILPFFLEQKRLPVIWLLCFMPHFLTVAKVIKKILIVFLVFIPYKTNNSLLLMHHINTIKSRDTLMQKIYELGHKLSCPLNLIF